MTPSRPYILRALYEWILDNDMTPHIAVDVKVQGVMVPDALYNQAQLVMNMGVSAIKDLHMHNEGVSFSARFGGVPQTVYFPTASILAIFAKESGEGMGFGSEPGVQEIRVQSSKPITNEQPLQSVEAQEEKSTESAAKSKVKKPTLTIVK